MIYNELDHSVKPHPGYVLIRKYDGVVYRRTVYLNEVFEKCGEPLDRPYQLQDSDFQEIKDPLTYDD